VSEILRSTISAASQSAYHFFFRSLSAAQKLDVDRRLNSFSSQVLQFLYSPEEYRLHQFDPAYKPTHSLGRLLAQFSDALLHTP
jgi:hypothetical protein